MVVKLYISGISGNKEVKKKQQRVQMILESKQISYEAIDITEPGKEKDKEFMQQNGKVRESLGKYPLPPQIFNDDNFCGDYEDFDLANEVDELEKFLHIETKDLENGSKVNGIQEEVVDSKTANEENHKVNNIEKGDTDVEDRPNEIDDDIKENICDDNNPTQMNETDKRHTDLTEKNETVEVTLKEHEGTQEAVEVEEENGVDKEEVAKEESEAEKKQEE